ncbi:MAG: DNA polymerase III subunit delta [Alphaproteobacteria bacterium]|jgi:DNA polymerase-3 subunit delta|nr:DNA polymerase III subunit delta [Alphaproteobacteria bacterium]
MKWSGKAALEFCNAPAATFWAALCHCEDDGVANDAARALIAAWSRETESHRLVLTEEEVSRDSAMLFDALEARALLGGRTLIQVRLTNEKLARTLGEAVALGDKRPAGPDNRLVVISRGLKKSSKLRKAFEDAARAASLQLFTDDSRDIAELVGAELNAANIEIEPAALQLFTSALPGHRQLARSELEKLKLYARGLERALSVDDVRALGIADVDQRVTGLVNAAFGGDGGEALRELEHLETAGTNTITILRALQREAERMLGAHAAGSGNVGMKLRPPVFAQQWPAFQARLRKWPVAALLRLLERIHDSEQSARLSGPVGSPVLRTLVNDMVRLAGRR